VSELISVLDLGTVAADNEGECPRFRGSGKVAFVRAGTSRMPPTKKTRTNRSRAGMVKKTKASSDQPIAAEPSRVGKRGTVVIPAALRRRYGIEEGTLVLAEPHEGGVLIRPAVVLPVEVYTAERKAQFLLSNAVDAADYAGAVAAVRAMGLDPNAIPHYKPPGV